MLIRRKVLIAMCKTSKKPRTRRTQVSLSMDDYQAAKALAAERGQSLSQVIREALHREIAGSAAYNPLGAIIGIVGDADSNGSEDIDHIVYGKRR